MDNLLFELLQVSLGTRVQLSRVLSSHEWLKLLDKAQQQTIEGVLTVGLEQLPKELRPQKEILLQWIGFSEIIKNTYTLHQDRARELTKIFLEAGLKTCILKGLSSAKRYPNPASRQCGDIDIWVLPYGECKRAEVTRWLKGKYDVEHIFWHHVDAKIFDDVPVEVHFHPIWLYNPWHNKKLQRFFEAKTEGGVLNGDSYNTTSSYFDAVYQLTHCFHHLLEEGIGLRHIIDYYYVLLHLSQDGKCKKADVLHEIKALGLSDFLSAMMWVIQVVCFPKEDERGKSEDVDWKLCEPNEKEGRFLLNEIMRGGNFGHHRNDNLQRNTIRRWSMVVKHYPNEVLWMVPWKIWHKSWMLIHKND